jgi:hypothetical protein
MTIIEGEEGRRKTDRRKSGEALVVRTPLLPPQIYDGFIFGQDVCLSCLCPIAPVGAGPD